MVDTIKWGVLSTARIGTNIVIPATQAAANNEVAAIASRNPETAKVAADRLGIPKAYGNYNDLLADPDIDAIYNPLPNDMHLEWTSRAAEAGKHVLSEKPLTMDVAEAERMLSVRDRCGVHIVEAFMVRYHPRWLRARELVQSGRLGEIRLIQTIFSRFNVDQDDIRNRHQTGGGAIYDKGSYALTTARFILGKEPERLVAQFMVDPEFDVDVVSSVVAVFPNNCQLSFTAATQMADLQRVEIFGTDGRLTVDRAFTPPPDQPTTLTIDVGAHPETVETEQFEPVNQYTAQAESFARVIRGEIAPPWPLEDAIRNMRAIDATFRSHQTGQWASV